MYILQDETLDRLYRYIANRNGEEVHVKDMVAHMESSTATVRRQLNDLESKRLVIRTHGGARSINGIHWLMRSFEERVAVMADEKRAIAAAAAELIKPEMTIAMDGGTTTWMLAKHIAQNMHEIELTMITNSLVIIQELARVEGVSLTMVGGNFRKQHLDFVGHTTLQQLTQIRSEIAFIGCDGVLPEKGVYGLTEEGTAVSTSLLEQADLTVLLADSSKIDAFGRNKVASFKAIDYWYTDTLSDEVCQRIAGKTECVCVEPIQIDAKP